MSPPTETEMKRVQAVIHAFAQRYGFLHEKRIHKLLFCAEYTSLERRGQPLLGIPFKRYHYGVYSDPVSLALSRDTDLRTEPYTSEDGSSTVIFLRTPNLAVEGLTADELLIIDQTHEWTKSHTTEELAAFGKGTPAWEAAQFGEPLDLELASKDLAFKTSAADEKKLLEIKRRIQRGEALELTSEDALMKSLGL